METLRSISKAIGAFVGSGLALVLVEAIVNVRGIDYTDGVQGDEWGLLVVPLISAVVTFLFPRNTEPTV